MAFIPVSQDEFNCSICLDLLKDPVTVPCGHSFCLNCISGCWNQEDQKGVYSCPQCRDTFTLRPVLRKNTMLTEVMEKLKKTEFQSDAKVMCYAGPGDVECDFCSGKKLKAIKSCLTCLVSCCELHIQPHYEVPRLSKHKLVKASSHLQERICSQHDRILEAFCYTDQKLICMLCSMDDHNGHKTVTAKAERTEKQKSLLKMKGENQMQIQQRKREVEEVKQALKFLKASTQEAVKDTERIFTELISFLKQKHSEVTKSISNQERAEVRRAERLLEQLELEIAKLKSRDAEMQNLGQTEDPFDFIQNFQSYVASSSVAWTLPKATFEPQFSFSEVIKSVSPSLREKTKEFHQDILKVTGFMVGDTVKLKVPENISKTCKDSHGPTYDQRTGGHNHNNITISGVGVITALTGPDTLAADFPGCPNWKGTVSQLDMVVTLSCEMPDLDQSVEETYDDLYEDYEDYEEYYEGYYSSYVCTGRKKKNLNMW